MTNLGNYQLYFRSNWAARSEKTKSGEQGWASSGPKIWHKRCQFDRETIEDIDREISLDAGEVDPETVAIDKNVADTDIKAKEDLFD